VTSISWSICRTATTCLASVSPLQRRLAEIAGRPTDLIPEHELSPFIRDSVLREAVEL
jgi:predicted nucleotidyltransferase